MKQADELYDCLNNPKIKLKEELKKQVIEFLNNESKLSAFTYGSFLI